MKFNSLFVLITLIFSFTVTRAQVLEGELRRWHKVSLTFNGPSTSEIANPNPFSDYRLEVTFTHNSSNRSYTIPGYFAACGNAENTGCDSGNKWRVNFAPDDIGVWNWEVSFISGSDAAIGGSASSAGFMDGATGSITIRESNKSGKDFRNKNLGRLTYVGQHYLKHIGTNPLNPNGPWFLKAGADSPENCFHYEDFDGTPGNTAGGNRSKTWQAHQRDYLVSEASEFTWRGGKGTELLGVVNYLSSQGANVMSFLTWATGGDDGGVFPHILRSSLEEYSNSGKGGQWDKMYKDRFDVSKLAQWEKVMQYADQKGMYLHFKTMETENCEKMDGHTFGRERKLYYRELVARFGHHLALNWNLSEETTIKDNVVKLTAAYLKELDAYNHHMVIHTYPGEQDERYTPLLGENSVLTGASVQTAQNNIHRDIKKWIQKSKESGKKWVVANDEQGTASEGIRVSDKQVREKVLWATLLAGGTGVEYYSGYTSDDGDLNGQDHRKRGNKYKEGSYALHFFNNYLQDYLLDMVSSNDVTSDGRDYVFAKPGAVYAVYRPNGGATDIDLPSGNNQYYVQWFNPRAGGNLTDKNTLGNNLTAPDNGDWVALITRKDQTNTCQAIVMEAVSDFPILEVSTYAPAYVDANRNALAINASQYKDRFAAAKGIFDQDTGKYNIRLTTLAEVDGESTYRIFVDDVLIGEFTNPTTNTDYLESGTTFENIEVKKGSSIRVEFNSHTNGTIPEGNSTAYARGRWTRLNFVCSNDADNTDGNDCNFDFEEVNGLAVIEAESLNVSGQNWIEKTEKAGFTGDGYLSWDGNSSFSNPGNGLITAKIKITTTGKYRFQWRNRVGEGTNSTESNDSWLKFPDASSFYGEKNNGSRVYPKGSGLTPNPNGAGKDGWFKIFLSGSTDWTWSTNTSDNDSHQIYVEFDSPGEYTMQISGRSKHHLIDRIVLYKEPNPSALDVSNSETICDDDTLSVEDFTEVNSGISVYPNPAKDNVTVLGAENGDSIIIYDIAGRVILTKLINGEKEVLNFASLKSGVYILRVQDKGTIRVVKE